MAWGLVRDAHSGASPSSADLDTCGLWWCLGHVSLSSQGVWCLLSFASPCPRVKTEVEAMTSHETDDLAPRASPCQLMLSSQRVSPCGPKCLHSRQQWACRLSCPQVCNAAFPWITQSAKVLNGVTEVSQTGLLWSCFHICVGEFCGFANDPGTRPVSLLF